jgi:hypothetical protein
VLPKKTCNQEKAMTFTFVSISRSIRSLIVHPAPLKSKAPHPNRANIFKSGRCPGGAAKVIDLYCMGKENKLRKETYFCHYVAF